MPALLFQTLFFFLTQTLVDHGDLKVAVSFICLVFVDWLKSPKNYLEIENDGPNQSQSKFSVSFNNVFWPDVDQFDLKGLEQSVNVIS
jgi:hypothetical protein